MKNILSFVAMFVLATTTLAQNIRLHAEYPEYNKKGATTGMGFTVPSDYKTNWVEGDVIFFIIDGGDADKGFKAIYDGSSWSFAEWYKNGGMQDFKPEGGTVTFAMIGDNMDLSTDKPSNYAPSKTVLRPLTSYTSNRRIGDIMFTSTGTYTVDDNGDVDINLNFTRPMAKIHIKGAYMGAPQIRNHVEGTKPTGTDNAAGTNANYNKAKTMTLNQIIRFQPSSQTFRDAIIANNMNGTSNMVYEHRADDQQIIDAVYYGTLDADENGDITIVMCMDARTYPGIQANAALGNEGQVAYWRKFPGMTINPNEDIYIYGPMSEEEAHLWTPQAIYAQMYFTISELSLVENQQIALKPYFKWKTPAPSDRTLTFEVSNPNIVSISEDGSTLTALALGTTTITATTVDGYSSTMTVNVKEIPELIDANRSSWAEVFLGDNSYGWTFLNNTTVDLTITKVAMMVPDGTGGYKECASADGLNLVALGNNGTATGKLKISDADMVSLDNSILRISYSYEGKSYSIDVPRTEYKGIPINEVTFPDESFRSWILEQTYGSDGVLTEEEIAGVISIDVSYNSNRIKNRIKDLKGIEFFTSLTTLYCYENQLTSLDVSKNTALTALSCGSNQLTSLDVSKNTALLNLACGNNQLTSLDLSKNTALTYLSCGSNQIKGSAMDALIASMPALVNYRRAMYVKYNDNEGNVMTTTQVAAAKEKGWLPLYYDGSRWLEYAGSEPEVLRGDVNGDGKVDMDDVKYLVQKILNGKFPDE